MNIDKSDDMYYYIISTGGIRDLYSVKSITGTMAAGGRCFIRVDGIDR